MLVYDLLGSPCGLSSTRSTLGEVLTNGFRSLTRETRCVSFIRMFAFSAVHANVHLSIQNLKIRSSAYLSVKRKIVVTRVYIHTWCCL
jgi:hypothetical protein